ncbi:MAG: hypothetical protein JKY86_08540 [Gammaproteobacteria bacterium]|nr:hypothetical protein [Gammaproteobacteria bacterium]
MKLLACICGFCACLSMLTGCTASKGVLDDENVELGSRNELLQNSKELKLLDRTVRGRNGITGDQLLDPYFH